MSMMNRPMGAADTGETVLSVTEYEAAQKAVSKLIAGEVPAKEIAIVGLGVRTIEKVTGRLGYATAARTGAINGILIGLFLSAILVLTMPEAPMQLFVGFLFIGIAIGMCFALISYTILRRRRDFASVMQLAADHYEVRVQSSSLGKARGVLGQNRAPAPPPVNLDEPPQFGERIPPGADPAAYTRQPGSDTPPA
ncbi:general stress protein [Microbacterium sp. NIBRBAC000506063]|uniref:general stress protein n=1 Tax=Microbacterium sp. NIBRBAC000506063 TaxID=2734618 RepID=UPI001BB7CE1A|nr:general stress protein [Microbacterium sp. NIBRBAC000506063]QTV79826.1 hypothetical protein KAE78_00805 [Microbacterium sp. NIBRBAC000506063]